MTVGRNKLTEQVADKIGAIPNLYNIVGAVFDAVAENLAKGDAVAIRDFGIFKVVQCKERKGRNPQTGEEIIIPAHKTPLFKASKNFKKKVNFNRLQ